jgi:nitrite reductase/ring-hydroxylating ferredoxin subunit
MSWASLCELSELTEGEGKSVDEAGFRLAVFLHEGEPRVIDDECPHARASLGSGYIDRGCAVCPLHGWAFNLRTGELRGSPGMNIRTYPARLKPLPDGRVLVQADLPTF